MTDRLRLTFTYSIAAIIIVGGLAMLYATRLDPPETDVQGLRLLLAGFVGSALTFVFGRESSSSAAFQSERAYAAGLAAPTIPSVPIPGADATVTTTTTKTTASEGHPFRSKYDDPAMGYSGACTVCGLTADAHAPGGAT